MRPVILSGGIGHACDSVLTCGLMQVTGYSQDPAHTQPPMPMGELRYLLRHSALACVTWVPETQAERKDSSHPVHVDNCILNAEALVCIKEPPAYTFRDYRYQLAL